MKSNNFNYSLLAVGVAAVMGISTGAMAGTTSGATSNGAAAIENQATASYSVGTVAQPTVTSNKVIVNVTETANFSLFAIDGGSATDDKNENISTTPGSNIEFKHVLINEGNVSDTYTINTTSSNDTAIDTATPNYTLPANVDVAFVIRQKGGATLTTAQGQALSAAGQATTGTLTGSNRTVKLLPGLEAGLSYTTTTPSTRTGGDIAVGTLTATSTFITNATTTPKVPTLVNENQTIVRLPTFKIAKTATSNVDLSIATPQIDYGITVTNVTTDYSDTATNFVIRDVLPLGMTLTSAGVTANGATVTSSGRTADGRVIIDIAVPSLAVTASQNVTFKVNVDKAQYAGANATATNNVVVYDKFVGAVGTLPVNPVVNTNYDILDSTVTANDVTRVPGTADEVGGVGEDTAGTTSFSNRALVLSNPTTREIATASGTASQVTHTTIITNNGQDVEGTDNSPLTFTIADGGNNTAVRPVTGPVSITYTPPGNNPTPVTTTITPVNNVYTINNAALPGGIAKGGTVAINYNVSSGNVTSPTTVADRAIEGTSETTVVTLTPTGNGAPAATTVTDTTNVKGLTLEKFQALDSNCNGSVTDTGDIDFTKNAVDAKPDQCIIYRIDAKNTSSAIQTTTPANASGFNITGLTISDARSQFAAGAEYVSGTAASSATTSSSIGNATANATAIAAAMNSTTDKLSPQGTATLRFTVKIKNNR